MKTMQAFKAKVLVVDDDKISRRLLCKILQNDGFNTLEAEDSNQGIETLMSDREIDIVISDIMMPGDDGFEFKRQLQENPLFDDKKVVFCSSLRDADTILTAKSLQGSGYLLKPFQEKYIKETMNKILKKLLPILEKKQTVCKNLNMDASTYDTMLSSLIADIGNSVEKMKEMTTDKEWRAVAMTMNGIHLNTTNLGAFRLQKVTQETLQSLKNKQKEDIEVLIIKLEREIHRINLYLKHLQELRMETIQREYNREPTIWRTKVKTEALLGQSRYAKKK